VAASKTMATAECTFFVRHALRQITSPAKRIVLDLNPGECRQQILSAGNSD
jgi:hypothetical protein